MRSRVPTVCTNISGPLLLPDSKEYLSSLEIMINQSRAKHQRPSSSKQHKSDIEMDAVIVSVAQSASEDDERAPFIRAVS